MPNGAFPGNRGVDSTPAFGADSLAASGAVVAAALQLLRGPQAGGTVAVVLVDSGLRYLSTDLWPDEGVAPPA